MAYVRSENRGTWRRCVLNLCYADNQSQLIKQEVDAGLQAEFSRLQNETHTNEALEEGVTL